MGSTSEECHVIHEADDPDLDPSLTWELYEIELEMALEKQYSMIVIEPKILGDHVSKWIRLGNFIHKSSVLCSLGCLLSPIVLPASNRKMISLSLGGVSLLSAAIYDISWQFDPTSKYQVEYDSHSLVKVPLERLSSSSPLVLVNKDDKYRMILHNVASFAVAVYLGYNAYRYWCGKAWKMNNTFLSRLYFFKN